MNLTEDTFAYLVEIPVLEPEVFRVYHVQTTPFVYQDNVVQIVPEGKTVAIGVATGNVIDAYRCKFQDPTVCPNAIRRQMPCAEGIVVKNSNLLNQCRVEKVNVTLPIVKQVEEKQLMLTTTGERIEKRCLTDTASEYIKEGVHLLNLESDCTIESSSSWSC